MNEIILKTEIQLQIFFSLINNPKGLVRNDICIKIDKPRTTIFDNIEKLSLKTVNSIPYIKSYKLYTNKKGRPKVCFYIPKQIRNQFLLLNIPLISN